jgi:hypothetical protein
MHGADGLNDWPGVRKPERRVRAGARSKERHDATGPAKLILQLSHRARKEGCRKASWLRTCRKGGSARYADKVGKN